MAPAKAPSHTRRLRRASRLVLLAALVALVIATELTPSVAHPSAAVRALSHGIGGGSGGVVNLSVNLTDAPSFSPSNLVAPAGSVVDFRIANIGTLNHTFTISAAPNVVLPRNLTPPKLDQFLAVNGTLVNLVVAPGNYSSLNYSVPATAGGENFEVVSAVPYQFQAGMFGFFNVTGGAPASSATIQENTTDQLHFVPDQLVVNATRFPVSVAVQVINEGSTAHTWTLEGQSNNTLDPASFTSYFQKDAPLSNVNVPAGGGASVWANFTIAAPGVFEYICEVSGHFANGMYGWLYVGVAAPAPPAAPSTDIVQPGLLVGAGVLLGIGVLLAVAASVSARIQRVDESTKAH